MIYVVTETPSGEDVVVCSRHCLATEWDRLIEAVPGAELHATPVPDYAAGDACCDSCGWPLAGALVFAQD